jgi:hypothetical protein
LLKNHREASDECKCGSKKFCDLDGLLDFGIDGLVAVVGLQLGTFAFGNCMDGI